ncbi:MAG TPA: aminotransferase class I/II-fold pyridoxal phosphate-dependent enzyme [Candidatus Nanoarchaeia archaeon]|nr:LL-diaminopimelate aminotransferase [uncultured archaeon]
MALQPWLPQGGVNLFQEIKRVRSEAEKNGVKILNLSIGQPRGPALLKAREAASEAVMSDEESMHEYQDNGSPGVPDFARRFVAWHVNSQVVETNGLDFLSIPGIKSMLGAIPEACGLVGHSGSVLTTTNPGYPTPADRCRAKLIIPQEPKLHPGNGFLFTVGEVGQSVRLIMTNYPHNPSGQIATRGWWERVCSFCESKGIRIFNDAAYFGLNYNPESECLANVAIKFPNLSWAEAYSASKIIGNGTGWRVGAMVGSSDLISDIEKIKGNIDSGFVAFAAAGALHALETDPEGIKGVRETYRHRLKVLIECLEVSCDMQLAVQPGAGFFTLWKVPKRAFGEEMRDAEHFNYTMIERTGVVGVHFNPDYNRYAVCGDVDSMLPEIYRAFKQAAVEY